jgi:hypothetical protein
MSYKIKISEMLLKAGIHGLEQKELTVKLRNDAKAEDIRRELEFLFNRDLIQKFIKPSSLGKGGPPTTIWRATTNLAHHHYPKGS